MQLISMKGLSTLLGFSMMMTMVGGGGNNTQLLAKEKKVATNNKKEIVTNKEESLAEPEDVTLNFWHIGDSKTDIAYNAAKTVIADFEKEYPHIKIKVDTTEFNSYKVKIKAAAAANELPDVFYSWGDSFSQPFVEAGRVLAIDEYLEDGTKDKLVGGALTNVTYDGQVYGLTFGLSCGAMFFNEELFKENNIKIPETYSELVTAVKAFKAGGITPMAVSGMDIWTIAMYFDAMALEVAGNDTIVRTLTKKGSFKDPAFLNTANKFAELVSLGAFPEEAEALTKDESDIDFFAGRIPMLFNGSWTAGIVYRADPQILDSLIVRGFPVFEDGKGNKKQFTGGAVDTIMINADTKHKEAAVTFQKYFCENMAREAYLAGAYLPAWKVDVDETNINPLTVQLAELTREAEGFTLWWDTLLDDNDREVYYYALQELFLQDITPKEFIEKLESIYYQ